MQVVDFGPEQAEGIGEFGSRGARAVALGDGVGRAHVYAVHVEPGGQIGAHPAGFGQLFLVVTGSGWVAGADGRRVPLAAGQGAYIGRGEIHAKGSDSGMVAIMVQVDELRPKPPSREAGGAV